MIGLQDHEEEEEGQRLAFVPACMHALDIGKAQSLV